MDSIYGFFAVAFSAFFAIVNPVGNVMVFLSLTEDMGKKERLVVANRSCFFGLAIMAITAVAGTSILGFFQVNVDSLRVIGGILLMSISLTMMHGGQSKAVHTPEEAEEAGTRQDVSFFPLAIPMLAGPASMTTAIIVMEHAGASITLRGVVLATLALTFLICWILFRSSETIHRYLGITGGMVVTRVMGLILGALAVQFITTGLWQIYLTLQANGAA